MGLHKEAENPGDQKLLNPLGGGFNLQLTALTEGSFNEMERSRHYSMIWVQQGRGKVHYKFNDYSFQASAMLFFVPHQPFIFRDCEEIEGVVINFSGDFYCIEKHREEISCSGLLFNNAYDSPLIQLDYDTTGRFERIIQSIRKEFKRSKKPDAELLLSYLKIFLIRATRLKKAQQVRTGTNNVTDTDNSRLIELQELIEENYRTIKSPSDYASKLFISTKALGRLVKKYFNKTLTELIQERIIIEAKRELVLTDKLVKEIADELGYDDQYYFSRLFKKVTGISPQGYREDYIKADT